MCAVLPELIRRPGPAPFVDLGFGWLPLTTADAARTFRVLNPALQVVGTEIVPERVQAAQAWADPQTRFLLGGFEVDPGQPARLIRAANVLRQYGEDEVAGAWAAMGAHLEEGGWLLEGTSDPSGRVMVFNTLQKRGGALLPEGLLFSLSPREPFEPSVLQPRLPKNYIHRAVPGEPVHDFIEAWHRAWLAHRHLEVFGRRQVWAETARALARDWPIDRRRWLLRRGYLWLRRSP